MIPIKYVEGDATLPQGDGRKIIAHVCNDVGAWGAGFVMALSEVDQRPQFAYYNWWDRSDDLPPELNSSPIFRLGEIQFSPFHTDSPGVYVCNMIAQQGLPSHKTHINPTSPSLIPLRYDALRHCLRQLAVRAHASHSSIHMPRIGCGLAGGDWSEVQRIILQEVSALNIPVTVYDLPIPKDEDEFDDLDQAKLSIIQSAHEEEPLDEKFNYER